MKLNQSNMKKKLGMTKEEINIVLTFQENMPILQEEVDGFAVNTRQLHAQLGVGKDYSTWIKGRIKKYNFKENEDYIVVKNENKNKKQGGDRKSKDYIATIDMAKILCKIEGTKEAGIIYKYLYEYSGGKNEIFIVKPPREEIKFGEMLEKVTGFHFLKQYPICNNKYRIDFMLEDYRLMIEYDEEQHEIKNQKQKDEERIKECREWLKENIYFEDWDCPLIRVKKGYELEGLREIIEHLVGYEYLSNWDNKCVRWIDSPYDEGDTSD